MQSDAIPNGRRSSCRRARARSPRPAASGQLEARGAVQLSATVWIRAAASGVGVGELGPAGGDHAGEGGGAEEHVGEVAGGDAAQHLVDHRRAARRARAGRRHRRRHRRPRRGRGRPRTRARPRPGRRTPRSGAGRAATGSRRSSRPGGRPTPRRSPRCPRCRRGGAPGRRPRRRRSRGRRAPAASPHGRPPRATRTGSAPRTRALEEAVARRERAVVRAVGHALHGSDRERHARRAALRMRWSLTGPSVPSCWANRETRYSSSIQRARRSALARRAARRAGRRPGGGRPPRSRRPGPSAGGRGATWSSSRSRRRRIASEVRREAAQPVGPGLAEEAAADQPGQLLAHVLQARAAWPARRGR